MAPATVSPGHRDAVQQNGPPGADGGDPGALVATQVEWDVQGAVVYPLDRER
jgi:hypothetical protein